MNLNPLVHKITLAVTALHLFYVENMDALPLTPKAAGYILLGLNLVALLVKTFQDPPAKKTDGGEPPPSTGGTTRIVEGLKDKLLILIVALCLGGCSAAQQRAAGPAILDIADAVDEHAANVLEFVGKILPNDDHRLAALRAARASRDFSRFYALARPLVQGIASGGNDVPRDVAADLALGAAAAEGIEKGMRALSGRNPDGSPKP